MVANLRCSIPIYERVELPAEWIPEDSQVEIQAKVFAGYFTNGHKMTDEELHTVKGRSWEEFVYLACFLLQVDKADMWQ